MQINKLQIGQSHAAIPASLWPRSQSRRAEYSVQNINKLAFVVAKLKGCLATPRFRHGLVRQSPIFDASVTSFDS
jgi:hypothetical protein